MTECDGMSPAEAIDLLRWHSKQPLTEKTASAVADDLRACADVLESALKVADRTNG